MSEFSLRFARVGLVLLLTGSLSWAADPPAPKYVKLVHVATGKVLSVEDDSEDQGVRVMLVKDVAVPEVKLPAPTTPEATTAQQPVKAALAKLAAATKARQWRLEKDGDHFKLVNVNSGNVLDVEGDSTDEGASIIVWGDKTGAMNESTNNQRWSWNAPTAAGTDAKGPATERAMRIKSKHSSLVLDADSDGRIIQKLGDQMAKSQLWLLIEVRE